MSPGEDGDIKAQSRNRILSAARTLFTERGFFATRVADIARQAGMSPGNVYWHFSSKEALLEALLAEGFEAIEAMTAAVADAPGSGRERVELLLERTLDLYAEHAEFVVILGTLMGHGSQGLLRSLGFDLPAIGARYHANLGRVFEQARDEGAAADVDPNLLATFYFAFFNGLLITYADLWPELPRAPLRDAVRRLIGAEAGGLRPVTTDGGPS